jgi:hypothetical protein
LTSSSLARSLIRTLLIPPLFSPDCPAKSSYQPHGVSVPISRFHFHGSAHLFFVFGRRWLLRCGGLATRIRTFFR